MEALMDRIVVAEITARFQALTSFVPLHAIRTKRDYDKAVSTLNQLFDAGAADEKSPLADLVNTLGALIDDYEEEHHPAKDVSSVAMIRFLMEQHDLTQSDLPGIGTQGVVSEILRGKRELNVRQIRALCERFHVPSSVFI
ncbi:MAG: type II toxin-antitoxin system HigA family antitoxin [Burkholderiales bacterium]